MLERLDLTLAMERDEYNKQLKPLQAELHELAFQVYAQKRPVVIVFEGMDASGKGGTIKRLTERIDPRGYVVLPISAPSSARRVISISPPISSRISSTIGSCITAPRRWCCLLYTSPSPRDRTRSRMPSSA